MIFGIISFFGGCFVGMLLTCIVVAGDRRERK